MIELKNLSGGGGAYVPVRNLNCKLNNGGVIGIVGDRDAGYDTLLALLSGALLPQNGHAKLNGLDTVHDRARVGALVGYLPRGYEPDESMTPLECLLFAADAHDAVYERALRRAEELLTLIGLAKKRTVVVARLTYGERRMLAVAQTLMHAPAFLLLDAPFAGLTPNDAQRLCAWLAQLGEEITVLVGTHNPKELGTVPSRVMLMQRGALIDVCDLSAERSIASVCRDVLSPYAPVKETAPKKKKGLWQLLTASTKEIEVIDTDRREDTRK